MMDADYLVVGAGATGNTSAAARSPDMRQGAANGGGDIYNHGLDRLFANEHLMDF